MRARSLLFPLATTLLLAAACGSDSPTAAIGPDDGVFDAAVSGAVSTNFRGQGFFHVLERPPAFGLTVPISPIFFLTAHESELTTRRIQMFELRYFGGGLPPVGRHSLDEPLFLARGVATPTGFAASYVFIDLGARHMFIGHTGEVEITRSSRDRVEGRFRFTAVAPGCDTGTSLSACIVIVDPDRPLPDPATLPTVVVNGNFSAVPRPGVPGLRW
jgi:hypothetical protein